jgi:hypothetical protein
LDVWAVLWILVLAFGTLAPALSRGWMIGTYDLLTRGGLTSHAGAQFTGSYMTNDVDVQMIPWTMLNWTQVHHGSLPLWNPYNGLGLPLAFNWQSASFSLPSLLGYLVPLHYAYTATVIATLVIAGTGAYVLGRVLRFTFLGCIMVATVFELSGPLMAWLGYPQAQVMAWGGWLLASAIMVVRGSRRAPAIAFFALILAFSIYAGHPEVLIVMVGTVAVFASALLVSRAIAPRIGLREGAIRQPATDLALGAVAGCALGAPLLLPALQLTGGSIRTGSGLSSLLPPHELLYLVFSGFDGVPVRGNYGFGASRYYNEFAAYVGIVAVVLALVGVVWAVRRRRSEILATFVVAVAMMAILYLSPVRDLVDHVPKINDINWSRCLMALSLAIAVLAGAGIDAIIRSSRERAVRITLLGGFGVGAIWLAGVWLIGRNGGVSGYLSHYEMHVRDLSFVWPAVGAIVGLLGALLLWRRQSILLWRRVLVAPLVAVSLIAAEALFLFASGSILPASSATGYLTTPAITTLQQVAGDSTVGSGVADCGLGISPEANIVFGIHQLNLYDPVAPQKYYSAWERLTGQSPGAVGGSTSDFFCPLIGSLEQARLVGVQYLLEASGHPAPAGSKFVTSLKVANPNPPSDIFARPPVNEDVYRIPDSGPATVTALTSTGSIPSWNAAGRPVRATYLDSSTWKLEVTSTDHEVLRLRLTDLPGWRATVNGRPLRLRRFEGFMVQAVIPPGHDVIEIHYWPTAFTVGLVCALVAVVALAGGLIVDRAGLPPFVAAWAHRNQRQRALRSRHSKPPNSPSPVGSRQRSRT